MRRALGEKSLALAFLVLVAFSLMKLMSVREAQAQGVPPAGGSSVSLTAIGAGTVGAPSIAWSADADGTGTGLYRSGANAIAAACNGSLAVTIDGNGVAVPSGRTFNTGNTNAYIYSDSANNLKVGDQVTPNLRSGAFIAGSTSGDGLTVAAGAYARFDKLFAGAPTATDCDDAAEEGRIAIDSTNHRFYWCQGAAGWKYATGN